MDDYDCNPVQGRRRGRHGRHGRLGPLDLPARPFQHQTVGVRIRLAVSSRKAPTSVLGARGQQGGHVTFSKTPGHLVRVVSRSLVASGWRPPVSLVYISGIRSLRCVVLLFAPLRVRGFCDMVYYTTTTTTTTTRLCLQITAGACGGDFGKGGIWGPHLHLAWTQSPVSSDANQRCAHRLNQTSDHPPSDRIEHAPSRPAPAAAPSSVNLSPRGLGPYARASLTQICSTLADLPRQVPRSSLATRA